MARFEGKCTLFFYMEEVVLNQLHCVQKWVWEVSWQVNGIIYFPD
ncbi:MAG: hypothetical protein ACOCTU_02345 [Bacteroidota bacterium]